MNATDEAVARIKAAGFSHIKVELEGDLGRDGEHECTDCWGDGRQDCSSCDGEGAVMEYETIGQGSREVWEECSDCDGDGRVDCSECDGTGEHGNSESERSCEDFMIEHVSQEARDALTFPHLDVRRDNPDSYYYNGHQHMGFYEDGSVDSEFTFTVPIEKYAVITEWIDAFNALGRHLGNDEIDVHGSGMHVSLLQEGNYPSERQLDEAGIENFKSEVGKLLPALFFLASADSHSRDLGYRTPRVSSRDKYSAIFTHYNTCLEFRVFETCYKRPEAIFEYIQVMANTLKYYADPSLKAKSLGKKFSFAEGDGSVARFFNSTEQLRILNAQIKELKPADKTIKKLKADRGVHYTIKGLQQKEKVILARLRSDYIEYKKHYDQQLVAPLSPYQKSDADQLVLHNNMNYDEAILAVKNIGKLQTLREFLSENLRRNMYGIGYNSTTITT